MDRKTPYAVGLIGGIAMGKSLAGTAFQELGITVIDTDVLARTLLEPNSPIYAALSAHFGAFLLPNGQIDRAQLRSLIFSDPKERAWLENLLHPLIRHQVKKALNQAASPYCVVLIPLLKNKKDYPFLNRILSITTPKNQQMQRLLKREGMDIALAQKIIAAQASPKERKALADDEIHNNGDPETLKAEILKIHQQYLSLAQAPTPDLCYQAQRESTAL